MMKFKAVLNDGNTVFFIGKVPCPEMNGNNFFVAKNLYSVNLSGTNGRKYDFDITPYEGQKLPFFFVDKILKLDN